jgi:hypothetical protein
LYLNTFRFFYQRDNRKIFKPILLKNKVMAKAFRQRLHTKTILTFVVVAAVLFFQSCSKPSETWNFENQSVAPANISSGACIDVEGKILGGIRPYSTIFLYEVSNFILSDVLATIQPSQPIKRGYVNTTAGFKFKCLSSGKFAFVIPTTSYKDSVGFPLPYEFDCKNFSLRIVFQGGNNEYAIGTFWIKNASAHNRSRCSENPFLCRIGSGSLYRACHLEPESR